MRLTAEQRAVIKCVPRDYLGSEARVRLFGSRVDDDRRGGDIDLLVEVPNVVDGRVMAGARLAGRLERALGGRKVDILLVDPATVVQPVHVAARKQGVDL